MRVAYVTFKTCNTRHKAQKFYPWACKIVKTIKGYMCFESILDYKLQFKLDLLGKST